MKRGIGYNVSLSYISPETRTWVENYIRDAKPASMLLFDTRGDEAVYVKWLARTYPDTVFEYRRWIPDPGNDKNGDNQQLYLSPARWVELHRAFAGTRVFCTVNNEPNHGDVARTCKWHIEVMNAAHRAGIRTAIGGYAYGHPNKGDLDPAKPENWETIYGPYDEQMRVIAGSNGMAIVDIHEYGNKKLRDAVPYLIGRYKFWQAHLRRKGIGPVYWIIGEHGWATIEADDKPEFWLFYTIVNGWNAPDWEAEMSRQLKDIHRTEYANDPTMIGPNLFTLSDYSWPRSTYMKAPRARDLMSKGFESMATPTYKPYPPENFVLVGNGVRVREGADVSATIRATLNSGAPISVRSNQVIVADGYGWQEVVSGITVGWMALHGDRVTWSLKPVPAEPEPAPIDADALRRIRDHAQAIVDECNTVLEKAG